MAKEDSSEVVVSRIRTVMAIESWLRAILFFSIVCATLVFAGAFIAAISKAYVGKEHHRQPDLTAPAWDLRARLAPSSEVEFLGSLMVLTGAFPYVFVFRELPMQFYEHALVPLAKWVRENYRAWLGRLFQFTADVFKALDNRIKVVWETAQVCARWSFDTFILPIALMFKAFFFFYWNMIEFVGKFFWEVLALIVEFVVRNAALISELVVDGFVVTMNFVGTTTKHFIEAITSGIQSVTFQK